MTLRMPLFRFLALLLVAVAFILASAPALPPVVASHFAAGGAANGFMSRGAYVAFMVVLTVGVPLLLGGLAAIVRAVPIRYVNLPHREHWLAPERRGETLAFLEGHGRVLALFVMAFLCFVHWQVVLANRLHPPRLAEGPLVAGMVVFVAAMALWIGVLLARFRRRTAPDARRGR